MFCYIDLHIFLYILNTKKTVVLIDYMLSVLELELCTDLKCANTGHLMFCFNDFFLHLSSHMFTFQQALCYIEAIKLR